MPTTMYQARKIICPLGLDIEKIHACKNDCMLYRGDACKEMRECQVCKHPRYKPRPQEEMNDESEDDSEDEPEDEDGSNEKEMGKKKKNRRKKRSEIPIKVCWYLPIVPRLKRLFANPDTSKLMRWHAENRSTDRKMRHPADSPQWRNMDRKIPPNCEDPFGKDPRNIRFADRKSTRLNSSHAQ